MMKYFCDFFRLPVFELGSENARRAAALRYASKILFAAILIIYGINLTIGSQAARLVNEFLIGFLVLQILIWGLLRLSYVDGASILLLSAGWIVVGLIGRNVGGIRDEAIFGYVLIMLASGYLLGWRVAVGYTIASILAIWWLAYLEYSGSIIPIINTPFQMAAFLSSIFALIFFVVYVMANALARALKHARQELTERVRVEEKLEKLVVQLSDEIAERKQIQAELKEQAITDFLTGLFNRRYFFEVAQKEFSKALRYERPLSVIIFDLDLFKDINDTYGHAVGDKALAQIGNLLREMIRDIDVSARYGGEEFVILLPEMNCQKARLVAERLRKKVESMAIDVDGNPIYVTISAGVAGKDPEHDIESIDCLISKADQALYQAKRMGRNTVLCHEE